MSTSGKSDKASTGHGQTHNEEPVRTHDKAERDQTVFSAQDTAHEGISAQDIRFLEPARGTGELGWLGRYRVLRLLGKGGMGMVFLAEDPQLQRHVAIKVMLPELAKNANARERFLREARSTANIHSDHIVTIHESGEFNDAPYLVAELLEGHPLDEWLEQGQRMTPEQVLDLGVQIARGLEAAHNKGVIHRDIKPSNIWVEPSGRVKILDFGLARPIDENASLTQTGIVLGTPAYMAPEQADGKQADARSDLFSLGCVFYQMGSGVRPFDGTSLVAVLKAAALHHPTPLRELNPAIPPAFADLVARLLAKEPQNRPASSTDVVESLEMMTAENTPPVHKGRSSTGFHRAATVPGLAVRKKRIYLVAGLAVLAGLAGAFIVLGLLLFRDAAPGPAPSDAAAKDAKPQAAPNAQGITDHEILLGMSAPFSGPARELGREMEVGIRAYFNHVNNAGGIEGRQLKLVALDDGYEPDRALANMKDLYEQRKAFAVIGNVGTPTAEKAVPYALDKMMVFFGAFTGAPLLRRDPPDRYVFNVRASYAEETAAIVKYLLESKGLRPEQIAVFAQQDGYGDAGLNGVVKVLRKFGRQPDEILRVGHPRNSVEVDEAVQAILQHKEIRAVVMVSTYRPAAKFIRLLKDAKADLIFTNVSFVGADALADELRQLNPDYAAGVIVTQVVPHPASQSSLVLKYREALQRYFPNEKPNFGSLEGYINAAVFAEGVRRAGYNLTPETLVDALESIRNLDLGLGTPLNYGPSEHQASHKVWGTVLDMSGSYRILELE